MKYYQETIPVHLEHFGDEHESLLDEALHAMYRLQRKCPSHDIKEKQSNSDCFYKLPSECNFTIPHSSEIYEKQILSCIWNIHDRMQFIIVKTALKILMDEKQLDINNEDIEIGADSFDLVSMKLGNIMKQGKLYSFDMHFHSDYIGSIKLTVLALCNYTCRYEYNYSIKNINLIIE